MKTQDKIGFVLVSLGDIVVSSVTASAPSQSPGPLTDLGVIA